MLGVAVVKRAAKKIAPAGADQYMLRLPPGMRDAVAKLADANGRSMNTEIVAAIEKHLTGTSRLAELDAFHEKYKIDIESISELWKELENISREMRSRGSEDD